MNKLAILALGAFEQHAQHLPFETDTIIANAIIANLKDKFKDSIIYLPTQEIGYSPEHLFHKKTKSLSYNCAIENIIELASSYKDITKLLLINCHGGNSPIMAIAAIELRIRFNIICAYTSWLRFGINTQLIDSSEKHLDMHAGFIETSVMLHIAPQKVRMDKAKNFSNKQSEYMEKYKYLRAYGPHAFGWLMNDLNKEGACGNAAKANACAGKIIFENSCNELSHLIKELQTFTI